MFGLKVPVCQSIGSPDFDSVNTILSNRYVVLITLLLRSFNSTLYIKGNALFVGCSGCCVKKKNPFAFNEEKRNRKIVLFTTLSS
jgi:hypothetical protein